MITVTLDNLDASLAALARLADIRPLVPEFEAGADLVILDGRTYPPERPGQRYQRTGALGRGWQRQTSADPLSIEVDVFNRVSYAPYVIGDDQGAIFADRWYTYTELAAGAEPRVAALIDEGVEDWIRSAGVR